MTRTRRRSVFASLLLVSALGVALPGRTAQDKEEAAWRDGWEGSWSVLSWTASGRPVPADYCRALQVTFRGPRVVFSLFKERRPGRFQVEATHKPGHFDLWLDRREKARPAIYRLERERLTLCLGLDGKRPTRFESKSGSDTVLIVLKRGAVRLDAAEERRARAWVQMEDQKRQSRNNLKQLVLAMHDYHDTYKRLPPPALTGKDGKPLLSWRVALLPYLDQKNLYEQFKLNEVWDSPHNKKLLAKMPKVYAPVRGKTREPHSTYYQVFVGPGAAFETGKRMRLVVDISDGTSNTIFLAEAGEAVPWTKPADLPYGAEKPLPKLGGLFPEGFNVGMGDGWTPWVNRGFDERQLRTTITRAAGEILMDDILLAGGTFLDAL